MYSYVTRMYPYVTRMYSYVTRMYSCGVLVAINRRVLYSDSHIFAPAWPSFETANVTLQTLRLVVGRKLPYFYNINVMKYYSWGKYSFCYLHNLQQNSPCLAFASL